MLCRGIRRWSSSATKNDSSFSNGEPRHFVTCSLFLLVLASCTRWVSTMSVPHLSSDSDAFQSNCYIHVYLALERAILNLNTQKYSYRILYYYKLNVDNGHVCQPWVCNRLLSSYKFLLMPVWCFPLLGQLRVSWSCGLQHRWLSLSWQCCWYWQPYHYDQWAGRRWMG